MDALRDGSLLAATVGCGLLAGLFATFSVVVMPALRRRPAAEGMAAMQAINVAALTPAFMAVLFGTGVGCLALAMASWPALARGPAALCLLSGSLIYLIGTVVVTIAFNVPRSRARNIWSGPRGTSSTCMFVTTWPLEMPSTFFNPVE